MFAIGFTIFFSDLKNLWQLVSILNMAIGINFTMVSLWRNLIDTKEYNKLLS